RGDPAGADFDSRRADHGSGYEERTRRAGGAGATLRRADDVSYHARIVTRRRRRSDFASRSRKNSGARHARRVGAPQRPLSRDGPRAGRAATGAKTRSRGGPMNRSTLTANAAQVEMRAMKILYLCADSGIPVLGRKGASVHVRELIAAF